MRAVSLRGRELRIDYLTAVCTDGIDAVKVVLPCFFDFHTHAETQWALALDQPCFVPTEREFLTTLGAI